MKNYRYSTNLLYLALCLLIGTLSISAHAVCTLSLNNLLSELIEYPVTSTEDGVNRSARAYVTRLNNLGAEKRPVVLLMPGWNGNGNVDAQEWNEQACMFAINGYVSLYIGFNQTNLGEWHSDLAESAWASLNKLCEEQANADCSAVVIAGGSYGGTQTHPVVRYLHAQGVFDGSIGTNAGRRVVGILGQDSGYTQYWIDPVDADATIYSIAMIENLGDESFPVDSCDFGNCGARNRADYHMNAKGSQYVLSYCPLGGVHGIHEYAQWDEWVLSALKTMLHSHRGVPKFLGYTEPTLAVSNKCVTTPKPPLQADCLFNWAERTYSWLFLPATTVSETFGPYYYRHYLQSDSYLGISSDDNHVYFLGPSSGNNLLDAGDLSSWLVKAGC